MSAGVPDTVSIAPSILAADFAAMGQAVEAAEAGGADAIHVDVMDGQFVPEITFGRQMVKALRARTRLPLDVHLMTLTPERHVAGFAQAGADAITVHVEALPGREQVRAALAAIRAADKRAGLALKPATGSEALEGLWDAVDQVLVMTVEPGYGGQPFMVEMLPKLAALAGAARAAGREVTLAVDGGIDERTARRCTEAGARFLVAGSSVYSPRRSVAEGISALRAAIGGAG